MEVLNQTWRKTKKGKMILVHQEKVEVPSPEPTLEDRVAALEAKANE